MRRGGASRAIDLVAPVREALTAACLPHYFRAEKVGKAAVHAICALIGRRRTHSSHWCPQSGTSDSPRARPALSGISIVCSHLGARNRNSRVNNNPEQDGVWCEMQLVVRLLLKDMFKYFQKF
jgi:hypothetical protein